MGLLRLSPITYRQCVAQNNTVSFYVFIVSLLLFLISLEIGTMSYFTSKSDTAIRSVDRLWRVVTMWARKHHLRP